MSASIYRDLWKYESLETVIKCSEKWSKVKGESQDAAYTWSECDSRRRDTKQEGESGKRKHRGNALSWAHFSIVT